jgi:adenylate cyclase
MPLNPSVRRVGKGLLIGGLTAALGLFVALTPLGPYFESELGLTWLFKVRGPVTPPPDTAVVGIDATTGPAMGLPQLPRDWPRSVHARLIDALVARGAAVIVMDFDFSRSRSVEDDYALAASIGAANRVILLEAPAARKQVMRAPDGSETVIWVETVHRPVLPLALAARAVGPFPLPKEGETASEFWTFKASLGNAPTTVALALQLHGLRGYDRWRALWADTRIDGGNPVPPLANALALAGLPETDDARPKLETLMPAVREAVHRDVGRTAAVEARLHADEAAAGDAGARRLMRALTDLYAGPADRVINFYGPIGTIPTIPYHHLVGAGDPDASAAIPDLKGKVVFVGYSDLSDPQQPDRFYTVFTNRDGVDLSGVEIMASAFANLLTGTAIRPSDAVTAAAALILFGASIGSLLYLLPAPIGVPLAFVLAAAYFGLALKTFEGWHLWLPVATPLLVQLPFALLVGLMAQYLLRRRSERRITQAMSYYLPEQVFNDLSRRDFDRQSLDKEVYGVCLATDMSGFSTISEQRTVKELATFMNAYFDSLAQVLKQHKVDITEFHADTIMSAWTSPDVATVPREQAVRAAIDVVTAIAAFSRQENLPILKGRIGLQDGQIYIGHTGGGGRMAYGILGDTANTAARLESLNKHLGTSILASLSVVEDDPGILYRPLGRFRVVGRRDDVQVVEILARQPWPDDAVALCAAFEDAMVAYRAKDWQLALHRFEAVLYRWPADGPSRFYMGRCRAFIDGGAGGDDPTLVRMDQK